jgi:hypothetical protein
MRKFTPMPDLSWLGARMARLRMKLLRESVAAMTEGLMARSVTCRRRDTHLQVVDVIAIFARTGSKRPDTLEGNVLQGDAFHGVNLLRCGSGLHRSARRQRRRRLCRPKRG